MTELPTNATTLNKIESLEPKQFRSARLSMSMLGENCERFLWYTLHWCYTSSPSARMLRLFDRGTREEEAIVDILTKAGLTVWDEQLKVYGAHGHAAGKIDGKVRGLVESPDETFLLELKTHSNKNFDEVVKRGVEVAFPKHFAQMQRYMYELKLNRGVYVPVNKNTDAMSLEIVDYDEAVAAWCLDREVLVIEGEAPGPKLNDDPHYYKCKFCDAASVCHFGAPPEMNCRTCKYHEMHDNGKWKCSNPMHQNVHGTDYELSYREQERGCRKYELMPQLQLGSL